MKYYCIISKLFANNLANVQTIKFADFLVVVKDWLETQSTTEVKVVESETEDPMYQCLVLTAKELEVLEQSFNWNVWDHFPLLTVATSDMQPSRISAETAIELSKFMRLAARYDSVHPIVLQSETPQSVFTDTEAANYGNDDSETN